jgi:hypothetical protein
MTIKLSDFDPLVNTLPIIAGENFSRQDLAFINAVNGKAYRCRVTDYAAIPTISYGTPQTSAATGMVVAQTTVVSSQTPAYSRQAVVRDANGNIFTHTHASVSAGMKLNKYSPKGALLGSVTIDAANTYQNQHILLLSNGNVAVLAQVSNGITYAVCDSDLGIVLAATTVSDPANLNVMYWSASALSGGGFALVYQQDANKLLTRLTTYSNAGAVVQPATTIWTRSTTAGDQFHKIDQLSDGNLVIAVVSQGTTVGLYHGIVTIAGASVLSFTQLDPTNMSWFPELSVMPGYYCIANQNGSNIKAWVFNNAGALQGGAYTAASGANGDGRDKLVNDGVCFWYLADYSATTSMGITKIPITGTNYRTTYLGNVGYNEFKDGFYQDSCFVFAHMQGAGANTPYLFVFDTATLVLTGASHTAFGSAAGGTSGRYHRMIPAGDGAFICLYDYQSSGATNLCIGKYANTAVIGVAAANATVGAAVHLLQGAGAYSVNQIAGSGGVAFDMSATSACYGNKGTLFNNAAILKGM